MRIEGTEATGTEATEETTAEDTELTDFLFLEKRSSGAELFSVPPLL